jgi:hypothetical protein
LVNIPYLRNNISISLTLSAAAIALLLSNPLLLSNLLLQPVQAQTTVTIKTPTPANGNDPVSGQYAALTFDVQGTSSISDPSSADITSGTFQLQDDPPNGQIYTGKINDGTFTNDTSGASFNFPFTIGDSFFIVGSECSINEYNQISLSYNHAVTPFTGAVDCSSSQGGGGGGNTTTTPTTPTATTDTTTPQQQQPSSSPMTGSSQERDRSTSGSSNSTGSNSKDGDSDGIPDSSDKCTHNSNPRCFKEGDTSGTTTQQEQPSSSIAGNQTR